MRAIMKKSIALLALAGFSSVAAVATASAQNAPQPPQGWFKVCSKQEDNDICNVQNIRTANTGQLLTAVNLIQITGKVNRAIFQIAVPTGRVIPAGIGHADRRRPGPEDRLRNLPAGPLHRRSAAFRRSRRFAETGGEFTLTSINFQNQPNPITISLQGFTAAFDGEPLQQSEVESRQQQLQEAIEKRREDFQKRLKEEQEKAKQGG
jgi:invasion protein IalB